jgi:hypothetical protein
MTARATSRREILEARTRTCLLTATVGVLHCATWSTSTSGKKKLEAIECYFGGHSPFPSPVSTGQS